MTLDHPNFRKNPTFDYSTWVKYIQISHEKLWTTSEQLVTSPFLKIKLLSPFDPIGFSLLQSVVNYPRIDMLKPVGSDAALALHTAPPGESSAAVPSPPVAPAALLSGSPSLISSAETKKKGIAARSHEICFFFSVHKWENYRLFMGI